MSCDLTLTGENGASYTLTSQNTSVFGTPTANSVTYQLTGYDLIQISDLLGLNGAAAIDGTGYALTASAGWNTGAAAPPTSGVTVSNGYTLQNRVYSGQATTTDQLNALIVAADNASSGSFEIDLGNSITLTQQLDAINLKSGVTLDVNGGGYALDGNDNHYSGMFVYAGTVNIDDLTIQNTKAQGGAGGLRAVRRPGWWT